MKNNYHNHLEKIFSHIDSQKKPQGNYRAKFLLSRWIKSTISSIVIVFLAGYLLVSAAAPTGGYTPGTTLNPDCAPGDTDCIVKNSLIPTGGTTGQMLTTDGTGAYSWSNALTPTTGWSLAGNAGTNPVTDFIGTTDAQDLVFKTNNAEKIKILSNVSSSNNTVMSVSGGDIVVNNITFGKGVGNNNRNFIAGENALKAPVIIGGTNRAGLDNLAIGTNALRDNTTGFANTAIGLNTMATNTTGRSNTSIGIGIMTASTTASFNTALGESPLRQLTTGNRNVAVGLTALFSLTTGNDNIAIGYQAHDSSCNSCNASSGNIAIGSSTFYGKTSGDSNIAIGTNTGYGLTTGAQNILLGANSGRGLTSGTSNVIIGTFSGTHLSGTPTLSNNILIADGSGNIRWRTDNTGKSIIGSGITSTTVIGNTFQINHGTAGNSGLRFTNFPSVPLLATNASGDVVAATPSVTNGFAWGLTGNSGTSPATNFIGTTDAQDLVFRTNNIEKLRILSTGNVGIGTISPAFKLDVTGDINASGSVRAAGIVLTSDVRYKKDVTDIFSPLETITKIHPVTYTWNELGISQGGRENVIQYGFLAQELETVLPSLIETDAAGYKAVNYIGLTPILVEAVKQLNTKVDMTVLNTGNTSSTGFFDALKNWLGNTTNGLEKLFARRVQTDELCVGSVCVTQEQFLKMVQGAGTTTSGTNSTDSSTVSSGQSSSDQGAPQYTASGVTTESSADTTSVSTTTDTTTPENTQTPVPEVPVSTVENLVTVTDTAPMSTVTE